MPSSVAAELSLPPPFSLVTLREAGDAFAYARSEASAIGAGTLVCAGRFHLAEFALVLEPEEPLHLARRVVYAAGNAIVDALSALAPPLQSIGFDWPDAIRVDGALVGGLRVAWPEGAAEDDAPDWLVLGSIIRMVVIRAGEPGLRPLLGGLDEQGFEELSPASVIEGFSRYFLREMNDWKDRGFDTVRERWLERAEDKALVILDDGDLLCAGERKSLAQALATPSWLDSSTGAPWI